ncbi:histidine phosphatase family protein [Rhodococcus opacus]|nr:histidine phosphatase family protein [Rhodococcus opacus]
MELALVRNAQPDRPGESGFRRDPALGKSGLEQARAVADRLRIQSWDALYTSPRRRCRETAAVIADVLDLEPRGEAGLAESEDGRRSVQAVDSIIADHTGGRVVVITHGTVIDSFVGRFLDSKRLIVPHPTYTGVTHVMASRRGGREISCLNDSTHLRLPWPALCEQGAR